MSTPSQGSAFDKKYWINGSVDRPNLILFSKKIFGSILFDTIHFFNLDRFFGIEYYCFKGAQWLPSDTAPPQKRSDSPVIIK